MAYRPLRPLLVVDTLDIGGAERHVVHLALALHALGYRPAVACSVAGPFTQPLRRAGVPVHSLLAAPVKRTLSLPYARAVHDCLARTGADLVHSHLHASGLATAIAIRRRLVPAVHTEHSEGAWRDLAAAQAGSWSHRQMDRLIAVSSTIGRQLRAEGISGERIAVIPNALPPPSRIAARPDRSSQQPTIGVVARLAPEKGVDVLLHALPAVRAAIPQVRVVIVGDGPERTSLQALAIALHVEDTVEFSGLHPDARSLLSRFDVLAVPSRSEGSPLVVLEALAAGLPVVASAVGEIPAQLGRGRAGLLCPPGDPTALAAALQRVLADEVLRQCLRLAGLRSLDALDHVKMVEQVLAVYERARDTMSKVTARYA